MSNADKISCDILYNTKNLKYSEKIRQFQGCPTIAITKGGRIFLAWYAGGVREPHMDNFNLLVCSDDDGDSWSEPILIIPSNKEKLIHALDIQLWTSPDGKLFVFWVQNNTKLENEGMVVKTYEHQPSSISGGYIFDDFKHAEWCMVCDNPDDKNLKFSKPQCWGRGFLRCKPLVMSNGEWMFCNYDQTNENYGYSISSDNGKNYVHYYGSKKITTCFDETMAYETKDHIIRMLARTNIHELAVTESLDYGRSWSETKLSGIDSPGTRFYISRTPTGRLLLVNNDAREQRTNMTIYLSEDDGKTWRYKCCIDTRNDLSYPDVDFYNGKIYLTYDRERCGAKEILLSCFTEDEIISGKKDFEIKIISKPV